MRSGIVCVTLAIFVFWYVIEYENVQIESRHASNNS